MMHGIQRGLMRLFCIALLLPSLLASLWVALPASVAAAPPDPADAPPLRLQVGTFTPANGERPELPLGLTIAAYAPDQTGYYIVQFQGPVQPAWKDEVSGLGAEILDYLPDYAFKVRMTPAAAEKISRLEMVVWTGLFQPAYKLSPDPAGGEGNEYVVRVEKGVDAGLVRAGLRSAGVEVLRSEGRILHIRAGAEQLAAVAQIPDVAWVENYAAPRTLNDGAGVIVGSETVRNTSGYNGSTQIIAVADTGLGGGTPGSAHRDIPAARIVAIHNWPGSNQRFVCGGITLPMIDDGAVDADSGHGTHVTGSALGSGDATGIGRGMAPAARLVFQALENPVDFSSCGYGIDAIYDLTGVPANLVDLFQQSYADGARIQSNSWGSDVGTGSYPSESRDSDQFIWDNRDMTIVYAAGNWGTDGDADGVVDSGSVTPPSTAKNVIAVGASENFRADNWPCDPNLPYVSDDFHQNELTCADMGGANTIATGDLYYFPVAPLANDPNTGNPEQMAIFSSRGPTADGRIKPDVVAPGSWVLSTYSDLYQEGYDGDPVNPTNGYYQSDGNGLPYDKFYKYMSGTSMATPIVSGGAAVIRDFYEKAHGHAAGAALVKATLINSAVDLLDENNDGSNDNDFPIPNVHEGWGRIDLVAATDSTTQFVDETTSLATGESTTYAYTVAAGGQPLKITLVWSDYPGSTAAAVQLVNDLDLTVTGPDGAVYAGNQFSNGWSQSSVVTAADANGAGGLTVAGADTLNNVENVYIQSPATGEWTVTISGANVPQGPQSYALVVSGDLGVPLAVTLGYFLATPSENGVRVEWSTATETGNAGFNLYAETEAGRQRINPALIPSTVIDSLEPQRYAYDAVGVQGDSFFIELVNVNGGGQLFGPFALGVPFGAQPTVEQNGQRIFLPTVLKR